MAAGNKFRHAQRSLPRVKQIPLRFKSETTRLVLLYFVRKEGEAVSTGVIEKSILIRGLLDSVEPRTLAVKFFQRRLIMKGPGKEASATRVISQPQMPDKSNEAESLLDDIQKGRSDYLEEKSLPILFQGA